MLTVFIKKQLPKPSKVLNTYWQFAAERQNVFFNRIDKKDVLTSDPILLKYKFTNAYRASDRVSQYLIKNIIYDGDENATEILFRILLFKIFNKIETWELLKDGLEKLTWETYSFKRYSKILHHALALNETIYSAAYIMASGKSSFGYDRKHDNHLKLIEQMMISGLSERIQNATSMEEVYNILISFPSIGSFLAYQYAIDINYSEVTNFSETEFVVPGPGAKDGIRKCFNDMGDFSEADVIKYVTDIQVKEFDRLEIDFKNLWGRELQLIDCQNLFCETDKYARVAHPDIDGVSNRKRIKQIYSKRDSYIEYFYPPKWNLNTNIRDNGEKNKNNYVASKSM